MRKIYKKYEGFSLVEMLLTIAILGIVTLLVATTLTTLIKVSLISNSKNQARNDVNFIMELMNRSLGNTNVSDITLYNSNSVRKFDSINQKVVSQPLGNTYQNPALLEGVSSNEIHVRSYGYNVWTCIGYFEDVDDENPQGYLLKTSVYEMDDHSDCFNSDRDDAYVTVLHNYEVDVKDFSIEYLVIGDDGDNMFVVDTVVEPKNWPVGFNVPVNREITRQITVSSQGLTWY